MEAVKWGVEYDQYNMTNSAAFEVILRRAQTIEFSHAERLREQPVKGQKGGNQHAGGLTFEEQEAFAGTARSSTMMVCPALLDHVRDDVARQGDLMKTIVKSREFRETLRKG